MRKREYAWPHGGGIYAITNKITGRRYYGQGMFSQRMPRHRNDLRKNKHINIDLQADWNIYSEENFTFEVLEIVPDTAPINRIEARYILSDPDCYNRDSYGYIARLKGAHPIEQPTKNNPGRPKKKQGKTA